MAKQILTIIKDELIRMKQSNDLKDTKTHIPWKDNIGFSVECTRGDYCGDVYDDDGNVVYTMNSDPVEFEVYYQVDGKDTDCCTLTGYLDKRDTDDLAEFVKMYR